MAPLRDRIAALAKSLTPSERKVAEVLVTHDKPFLLSITGLAELSGVSEATVVRLYRRLRYSSYQELRVTMAQEMTETDERAILADIAPGNTPLEVLAKVNEQTIEALRTTAATIDQAELAIAAAHLSSAERLYFMGVGASGVIALDAAHKFLRLGGTAVALVDSHIQMIAAAHMRPGDVVIAISHSGESTEVLAAARQMRQQGALIIGITGYGNSSLCQIANTSLITAAREAQYRSDAMASRIVQLVLIDTLYVSAVLHQGQGAIDAVNRSRLAVARRKR